MADSGPLHYLILLQHIELLRRFYGQVLVPEPVASELSAAGAHAIVREWDLLERLKATSFYPDDTLLNAVFDRWLKR